MGCLSVAYKTILADAPDGLPPAKEPPHHRRLTWEIKMKILGTVFSKETFIKLSKDIPLDSCVQEYRDQDKMWQSHRVVKDQVGLSVGLSIGLQYMILGRLKKKFMIIP